MAGGTERPGRRAQGAATRAQLLGAAREVFERRGYQATTVAEITRTATTAHGTFYLYFRNKEHVFSEVVRELTAGIYERGARRWPAGDPRSGIDSIIRGYLVVFVEHRNLWRCLLEASFTTPSIEAMYLELRQPLIARLARNLRQQVDAGSIRSLDPDLTATALASMVEWTAATEFILDGSEVGTRRVDELAGCLVEMWCAALYGDGTPGGGADRSSDTPG